MIKFKSSLFINLKCFYPPYFKIPAKATVNKIKSNFKESRETSRITTKFASSKCFSMIFAASQSSTVKISYACDYNSSHTGTTTIKIILRKIFKYDIAVATYIK